MASFVAHEDIKPLKKWREEIEKALKSMDLLLALLTEDFRKSKWTDQEVGVAIGREVRVMPVRMGKIPTGLWIDIKLYRVTWAAAELQPKYWPSL